MSVDEKTAPFEVREFTARDAAISVLRTMESAMRAAKWMFLAVCAVWFAMGFLLGPPAFVVSGVLMALAGGCAVVHVEASAGVKRLAGESVGGGADE